MNEWNDNFFVLRERFNSTPFFHDRDSQHDDDDEAASERGGGGFSQFFFRTSSSLQIQNKF